METDIAIKNMVCRHCVAAVTKALSDIGIDARVSLGHASFDLPEGSDTEATLSRIDAILVPLGFERICSRDSEIVEKIKLAVLHHLRDENECRYNLSACIEAHLGMSYDQASRIFSRIEGRTVEKYHILQKTEYVKELLGYGGMTLAEIADRTGYSSAAHLSRQFKDVTGMTPTQYLHSTPQRKGIEEV